MLKELTGANEIIFCSESCSCQLFVQNLAGSKTITDLEAGVSIY